MTEKDKQKLATDTYNLGLQMTDTFKGDEKQFMVFAIYACISGLTNSNYTTMPMPNLKGDVLKAMRVEKKYTLRQVEDATGVSNSYLSQLETGKITNPSHDVIIKLINFYNCNVSVEKGEAEKCCGRCIDGLDKCIHDK